MINKNDLAAALKLVGPVGALKDPDTPLERMAMVLDRLGTLAAASDNPHQTDFKMFLRDCVWTTDEARGGRVAQAPQWPHIPRVADLLVTERLLFLEKSRRVWASWEVCAFDVWLAAGGQDPRWLGAKSPEFPLGEPSLMMGNGYRQVYVVARKFEKPGSDWFLQSRIKFICEEFERRGGRKLWPDFPQFAFKEGEATFSNGSHITAVAQGADQLRGPGATFVHCEEGAFWELAQPTMEGLLPTTKDGGHVCLVTTAQAGTYCKKIRDGELKSSSALY